MMPAGIPHERGNRGADVWDEIYQKKTHQQTIPSGNNQKEIQDQHLIFNKPNA